MPAGSFNTGKIILGHSGDVITHYRLYWGTSSGNLLNMESVAFSSDLQEVDIHDVVSAPGVYYIRAKGWNGSNELGDSGEKVFTADMGYFRTRK